VQGRCVLTACPIEGNSNAIFALQAKMDSGGRAGQGCRSVGRGRAGAAGSDLAIAGRDGSARGSAAVETPVRAAEDRRDCSADLVGPGVRLRLRRRRSDRSRSPGRVRVRSGRKRASGRGRNRDRRRRRGRAEAVRDPPPQLSASIWPALQYCGAARSRPRADARRRRPQTRPGAKTAGEPASISGDTKVTPAQEAG
jgi:hypothetical protein